MATPETMLWTDEVRHAHVHVNGTLLFVRFFDRLHVDHDIVGYCVEY